jgi:tRNA(Ile)-lysidine synthase
MKIDVEAGIYVMAVSGGVDSVVLLDLLAKKEGVQLIVAHFDHGMRTDARADRLFVQRLAKKYGLPFIFDEGQLGQDVSENIARAARYKFLDQVKKAARADGIITAHHQDDMIETAIINLLRGTGRRGLTALKSNDTLLRPMLHATKEDILAYARARGLAWHEDSTNIDTRYLRNYVRHKIVPRFTTGDQQKFLGHIEHLVVLNRDIDAALVNHLHIHPALDKLDRHWFIMLPHSVASEVMYDWLRGHGVKDLTKNFVEKLIVASKTLQTGKKIDIDKTHVLAINKATLALLIMER